MKVLKLANLSLLALLAAGIVGCKKDEEIELPERTLWVVGDSTVCDYAEYDSNGNKTGVKDKTYFFDRYGYATQFSNYLSEKITVKNLALSGRSSKSFITDENGGADNYKTIKDNIKAGDYLVIGFGHNDEKSDDEERFSSANGSTTTADSFKYNLYNYYIKMAEEKGATSILCSPIVRANKSNDYTGSSAHITADGNYEQAIIELGHEKDVQVVKLTELTKTLYTELGYDEAIYMHAILSGLSANEPNMTSVDTTHINKYGAEMVSYLFMNEIKSSNCDLKDYITNTNKPVKDSDFITKYKNPYFKYTPYDSPNFATYKALVDSSADYAHFETTSEGWYGTGFGDAGGNPMVVGNGYVGKETSTGVFTVGQGQSTGSTTYKGKLSSTTDGRGYVLRQVDINKNFIIEADAKVVNFESAAGNQAGFGLVVRDECYLNTGNDSSKGTGNSFNAGLLTISSGVACNFSRESGKLESSSYSGTSSSYAVNTEAHFKIERVGQIVTCTTIYNGQTFTKQYIDVDLAAIDYNYIYVGMFGTRGTIAEFSNVTFTITGDSQGA